MKSDEQILASGLWGAQPVPMVGMRAWIKLPDCGTCSVIWTRNMDGWEHVSVSPKHKFNIPSWEDMCRLKDVFFDDEEEVYQIHPPKSHYVNMVNNCLHLWRPLSSEALVRGRHVDEAREA